MNMFSVWSYVTLVHSVLIMRSWVVSQTLEMVSLDHYMARNGECFGKDIKQMTRVDLDICASECDSLPDCRAFLFVPAWSGLDTTPYCWLKYATCNSLTHQNTRHYQFYDKFVNLARYSRRYGRCVGNDIKVLSRAGLMLCEAECDQLPHCTGFTYRPGRHDIRREPQCALKYKSCATTVLTSSREVQFYDKIANATDDVTDDVTDASETGSNSTDEQFADYSDLTTISDRTNGSHISTELPTPTSLNNVTGLINTSTKQATFSDVSTSTATVDRLSTEPGIDGTTTKPPPTKLYSYYLRPGDCEGSNLHLFPLIVTSGEVCSRACDQHPECVAFHLVLPIPADNRTQCYLKYWTCWETSAYSIPRLQFYDKIEVQPGYVMKFGLCAQSVYASRLIYDATTVQCRVRCDKMADCVGFDYRVGADWYGDKRSHCQLRAEHCSDLTINARAMYDQSYDKVVGDTGKVVTSHGTDATAFVLTGVAIAAITLFAAVIYYVRRRRKLMNPHTRLDQSISQVNLDLST